jgi:hypothetical protein
VLARVTALANAAAAEALIAAKVSRRALVYISML